VVSLEFLLDLPPVWTWSEAGPVLFLCRAWGLGIAFVAEALHWPAPARSVALPVTFAPLAAPSFQLGGAFCSRRLVRFALLRNTFIGRVIELAHCRAFTPATKSAGSPFRSAAARCLFSNVSAMARECCDCRTASSDRTRFDQWARHRVGGRVCASVCDILVGNFRRGP